MIFVWGSKGRTKSTGSGDFFCPDCAARRPYDLQEVKKWFTVYWIPVFPMETLGSYVECGHCKSTYNDQVLNYDPEAENARIEAAFVIATKRIMFMIALADGQIDPAEIEQITIAFSNLTGRDIDADDIAAELEAARDDDGSVTDYLQSIAPYLNDGGKEIVLRAAVAVARADGHVDPEETALLSEIGSALDMPAAYVKGVLSEEGIAA